METLTSACGYTPGYQLSAKGNEVAARHHQVLLETNCESLLRPEKIAKP